MGELEIDEEFRTICRQIVREGLSVEQWAARESDDMFQTRRYVGGYEAAEEAFTFSHYDADGVEHWFALTLEEVGQVASGGAVHIVLRVAEA